MYKWFTYFNALIFMLTFICAICNATEEVEQAYKAAQVVIVNFFSLFERCISSAMPNQQFLTDNIQNFINYPSKTTVGFAPKFTNNRKFFANLLSTQEFKDMLSNDENALRKDMIKKLKYCDKAIMNKDSLKDFYDREVDQTKI